MKTIGLMLLVMLTLAGCAANPIAIQVKNLGGLHQYPPSPFVEVITTPPDRPYTAVARLRIKSGPALDSAQIIEAIRQRAALLGANALIVQHGPSSVKELPGIAINPAGGQYGLSNNRGEETYIGTAIHVQGLDDNKSGGLSP